MNWLSSLLNETRRAESPRSFFMWAGLSAISAIVNNKVYLDKAGVYKLYPNIYVMLVAKSGMRKGLPVQVAKKLVSLVGNTRVISGRSSVQAIIGELSRTANIPGRGIIKDSIGYINSGEFSTSLVKDESALTILTDLHDGHYNPDWSYNLKGAGKEKLSNVCVTLLGAMNQTHFANMITELEVSGGFIARTLVVLEERRYQKDSLLRKREDDAPINYDLLIEHLNELTKLTGEFVLTDEAINKYEDWYNAFEPETMDDKTGTANRVHDQILKVAMLLSLSEGTNLTVNAKNIQDAMDLCQDTSSSIKRILAGSGIHIDAPKMKLVIQYLLNKPLLSATRKQLLSKFWGDIDKYDLDKIMETLSGAGGVTIENEGSETIYTLTAAVTESLAAWKAS